MVEPTSATKHLRSLATIVGTAFGEWTLFLFIEAMITSSTEGGGILEKIKAKYQLTEYITSIFEYYYTRLKPYGGSYAGAKSPAPGSATRASSSTAEPQEQVDDPQGDSNLQEVLKDIAKENSLDDRGTQILNEAASYFKLILEKALDDPIYGLRRNADKFHSFQPSMSDAYQILDEIMSELRPLEIIIMGPESMLLLEYSHATRHGASLRVDEIMQWRDILFKAFRSSTPSTVMNDTLLMERRPHLQQLVYLTSTSFEFRLKTRVTSGDTTFHAARAEIQPLINKIVNTPRMTAAQIVSAFRPTLKLYSATNIKTIGWATPSHQNTFRPRGAAQQQAHATQARPTISDGGSPHQPHANATRFANANIDGVMNGDRPNKPNSGAKPPFIKNNRPPYKPNKSNSTCKACGKIGHWAGDAECFNTSAPRQIVTRDSPKGPMKNGSGKPSIHWSPHTRTQ